MKCSFAPTLLPAPASSRTCINNSETRLFFQIPPPPRPDKSPSPHGQTEPSNPLRVNGYSTLALRFGIYPLL